MSTFDAAVIQFAVVEARTRSVGDLVCDLRAERCEYGGIRPVLRDSVVVV